MLGRDATFSLFTVSLFHFFTFSLFTVHCSLFHCSLFHCSLHSRRLGHRGPIPARIRRPEVYSRRAVVHHHVAARNVPRVGVPHIEPMPHPGQCVGGRRPDPRLNL